jgi:hypothetical protein
MAVVVVIFMVEAGYAETLDTKLDKNRGGRANREKIGST